MKIYDNVLPNQTFSNLKNRIFDSNFPWFFSRTSVENPIEDNILTYSFSHAVMNHGVPNSIIFDTINSCILTMLDNCNIKLNMLLSIRLGLLQPVSRENHSNDPHVDSQEKHKVGLFYLNTTDGATTVYNEKYDPSTKMDPTEYYRSVLNRNLSIQSKVECTENRLVIFDGMYYHSSTTPTDVPRRVALNFNFV
jgi:hypothetical protein